MSVSPYAGARVPSQQLSCLTRYPERPPWFTYTIQDTAVQKCSPVQQLSAIKHELQAAQSPIMRQVFAWLFPFGPGWNSGT